MTLFLVLWTLLPGILWGFWLYKRDAFEPEPIRMVVRAFLLGMAVTLLAGFLNDLFLRNLVIDSPIRGAAMVSFGIVAPVEELLKFGVVYAFFFRHQEFDEPIDGLIYAGTVALGFASAENLHYVARFGSEIIPVRGLLAVPAHFLFAASYGYAMGMKKGLSRPNLGGHIASTQDRGKALPHPNRGMSLSVGLLIAIVAHGAYNFSFFTGHLLNKPLISWGGVGIVMGVLILLWGRYVRTLESLSQFDTRKHRQQVI